MFRIAILALACAVLSGSAARGAQPSEPVAYTLSPEVRDGALVALDVSLALRAGPDGRVGLELPDGSAGAAELWRYIRDLKVEGARAVTEPAPAERLIEAAPGAALTVRYRVVSAYDHEPDINELETYKPLIRPRRFWVYGEALFVRPKGSAPPASFRWVGAPAGFGFASDLEHAAGQPMPLDTLVQSVVVGGPDLVIYRRDLAGAPLRVAAAGRFDFSPDAFLDNAARVIAGERAFWRAKEGPFLVALAPLKPLPGRRSSRGEGRGDAFAIQGGSDTPLESLKGLLAHEYFHTWNPARLGGIHDGDAERADYWFSEGFTDFYARRLALRSGLYSLDEFLADWNAALREYAASPVRNAPNARVVADFWKDQDVEKLPYQRGSILAAMSDRELRARSGGKVGLDDVMRAMRDRAAKLGAKSPKAPQLFEATARSFGLDVRPDVARLIDKGGAALLPKDAFGGCVTVTTRQAPRFELGYRLETKDGVRVIIKVEPGSAAYAAGLRPGMAILRREAGTLGDSTTPYRLRVSEAGVETTISFLPVGKGTETLQQLVIPRDLMPAAKAACARTVAAVR